jgi:hypothetical protein
LLSYVLLFSPKQNNLKVLDKLPVEIRTTIILSTNQLDKTITSLLTSDEINFEKNYAKTVNEFHTHMDQIYHTIIMHRDASKIIRQFYKIILSSLLQTKNIFNRELHKHEATALSIAIETISNYFKIINNPDSIILAFPIYLNLSVCITALSKIISDKDNSYQKHRSKLVQRCNKVTNQLKEAIEIIISTKEVEQKIKESDTYLSKKQLRKILAKEISNETLEYILKRLEFNNRIMYDKDGSIIWILADNVQIKKTLEESIPLR